MKIKKILCMATLTISQLSYTAAPAAAASASSENLNQEENTQDQRLYSKEPILFETFKNPFITARTLNLIIINDAYEQSLFENLEDPWNYPLQDVETQELAKALTENQMVLCHISLWNNIEKAASLWEKIVNMPTEEFIYPYWPAPLGYKELAQEYSLEIKRIDRELKDNPRIIEKALIQRQNFQGLISMASIYSCYNIIKMQNYDCRIIQNEFLLFIPINILPSTSKPEPIQTVSQLPKPKALEAKDRSLKILKSGIMKQNNFSFSALSRYEEQLKNQSQTLAIPKDTTEIFTEKYHLLDIFLGLKYTDLPKYDYKRFNLLSNRTSIHTIGEKLLDALKAIFINKNSMKLKEEFKNFFSLADILPDFNILLIGHGDPDRYIAEISITKKDQLKSRSTERLDDEFEEIYISNQSDFLELLKIFNNAIFCKIVTILSCYTAGEKLKKVFELTSKYKNNILKELSYPILIIGIMPTPITTLGIKPWNKYIPFFETLNTSPLTQRQIKEKKEEEQKARISASEEDLDKSSHSDQDELYQENQYSVAIKNISPDERLENSALIKYKNTEGFTSVKETITKVKAATQRQLSLKKDILLETNHVDTIIITNNRQRIALVNPKNPNYVIDAINYKAFNNFHGIILTHSIIHQLFFQSELTFANPVYVLIKELRYKNQIIEKNLIVFFHSFAQESVFGIPLSGYIGDIGLEKSIIPPFNVIKRYLICSWYSNNPMPPRPSFSLLAVEKKDKLIEDLLKYSEQSVPNLSQDQPSRNFAKEAHIEKLKEMLEKLQAKQPKMGKN